MWIRAIFCAALLFASPAHAGVVNVIEAYAKPTIGKQKVGVAFVTIQSVSDQNDALIAVESPQAARVELHTNEMKNDIMRMRKLEKMALPAHGEVRMEGGGLHLMLYDLKQPLKIGETIELILTFQRAPRTRIVLPVRK